MLFFSPQVGYLELELELAPPVVRLYVLGMAQNLGNVIYLDQHPRTKARRKASSTPRKPQPGTVKKLRGFRHKIVERETTTTMENSTPVETTSTSTSTLSFAQRHTVAIAAAAAAAGFLIGRYLLPSPRQVEVVEYRDRYVERDETGT